MLSDFDLELDADTLKFIEEQEQKFLTQHYNSNTNVQVPLVQEEVRALRDQMQKLKDELDSIKRETLTKEGEVAILRQKLGQIEGEKYEAAKKHIQKLQSLESEKDAMMIHWQKEIERLLSELNFKENELKMRSFSPPPPPHNTNVDGGNGITGGFTDAFSDLFHGNSMKRMKPGRKDAYCEAEMLTEHLKSIELPASVSPPLGSTSRIPNRPASAINRAQMEADFYRALGHADKRIAISAKRYRDRDLEKMKADWQLLHRVYDLVGDPVMAIEMIFNLTRADEKTIRATFFVVLTEFFAFLSPSFCIAVCTNYKYPIISEIKLRRLKELDADIVAVVKKRSTLLQDLIQYYKKIPIGLASDLQFSLLCAFRHIFSRFLEVSPLLPEDALDLLSDGYLLKNLHAVYKYNEVVYPLTITLYFSMSHDKRIAHFLTQQVYFYHAKESFEYSILNKINELLSGRILAARYHEKIKHQDQVCMQMLFNLVRKRYLPACVVFEPGTLRVLSRRLAELAWNERDEKLCYEDTATLLHLTHHVAVVEGAPLVKFLKKDIFNLAFATHKFSADRQILDLSKEHIPALHKIVWKHIDSIARGDYSVDYMEGFCHPRAVKLTREEEMVMLKRMIDERSKDQDMDPSHN